MTEIPYRLSVELAEFHEELDRCGYSRDLDKRVATWERAWRRGDDRMLSRDDMTGTEFYDSLVWLLRKLNHMSQGRSVIVLPNSPSSAGEYERIKQSSSEMIIESLGDDDAESRSLVIAWVAKPPP